MLPDLHLIRHGETVWNREERLQGRRDSPLTAAGRAQAAALAPLVARLRAAPLCSPQGRAVETARLLFPGRVATDPRLCEIDVGSFTGLRLPQLRAAHPRIFAAPGLGWYDLCPGGEGLTALAARCADLLADLTGPAILIGHGIALRMIWALATGAGPTRLHEAPLAQGTILSVAGGCSRVMPRGG